MIVNHIPAQQRMYIETFAETAVAMVAQQFAGKTNEEKKAIAMTEIKGFFKAFNLPIPPDDVISAFIESAVNALNKTTPVPLSVTLQGGSTPPPGYKRTGL
jgi:hypothetical protein